MSWEDCCFSHTPDNRFKNTVCNRWNCIKDDETRTFTSKGAKPRGAIREEIGGAGYGYGKRPYFYDDYQEMIKATPDKAAFDRMAARGYFPGRALLERPYGSKHYQDMKYQKPVSELTATTSVKEDYAIPEFEIPEVTGIVPIQPMRIYGKVCITGVSRLKVCAINDATANGIEVFDKNTWKYTKEVLVLNNKVEFYIYNIVEIKQAGDPFAYLFIFDPATDTWRAPTVAEAGSGAYPIRVVPGTEYLIKLYCGGWNTVFDNTYWTPYNNIGIWDGLEWDSVWYAPSGGYYRLVLTELGTWVNVAGQAPYMRLTFTGVQYLDWFVFSSDLKNLGSGSYYHGTAIESGDIITLNWAASSGVLLRFGTNTQTTPTPHTAYSITNIEVYF